MRKANIIRRARRAVLKRLPIILAARRAALLAAAQRHSNLATPTVPGTVPGAFPPSPTVLGTVPGAFPPGQNTPDSNLQPLNFLFV